MAYGAAAHRCADDVAVAVRDLTPGETIDVRVLEGGFTTGQGNVIGHPTVPVIKISPNTKTVETMREHIDVDLTRLLVGEMTLEDAAKTILQIFERTVRGRLTAAEVLNHREFVLTKLYRSA